MYSWPIFKQLVEGLHWVLVTIEEFLSSMGLSDHWTWGLSIIGLTIIVRLILFPLTWKQYSSAQALQAMQPRIKELQRKYKDDRAKLQQETMKVYQEHRVNPFASCLPLLLQLPIFIALYAAISGRADYLPADSVSALANASFLWIPKLGEPDPYHVLLIFYVVTQLISTELMLATQTDKMQKTMMRAMPIVFVVFLWNFPAGLFVYWVTTNLWTIGQQLLIRRVMKPHTVPAAEAQKPARRSRIVDALVAAQEKGDQARTEKEKQAATAARRASAAEKKTRKVTDDNSASGTKPSGPATASGRGGGKSSATAAKRRAQKQAATKRAKEAQDEAAANTEHDANDPAES